MSAFSHLLLQSRYFILRYAVTLNVLEISMFAYDKLQARRTGWRVAESTLLLVAIAGGSPGAFLASRCFRHKLRKQSFMRKLWGITLLQLLAIGYLVIKMLRW